MTQISRDRREALFNDDQAPESATISIEKDDLRALLADSAWRERVERQVKELADESERRGKNGHFEQFRDDPTYAESAKRAAYKRIAGKLRAIVDTGDEEGE